MSDREEAEALANDFLAYEEFDSPEVMRLATVIESALKKARADSDCARGMACPGELRGAFKGREESAAKIERLKAEIVRQREGWDGTFRRAEAAEADRDTWKTLHKQAQETGNELQAEVEAAEARIKKLEARLAEAQECFEHENAKHGEALIREATARREGWEAGREAAAQWHDRVARNLRENGAISASLLHEADARSIRALTPEPEKEG